MGPSSCMCALAGTGKGKRRGRMSDVRQPGQQRTVIVVRDGELIMERDQESAVLPVAASREGIQVGCHRLGWDAVELIISKLGLRSRILGRCELGEWVGGGDSGR